MIGAKATKAATYAFFTLTTIAMTVSAALAQARLELPDGRAYNLFRIRQYEDQYLYLNAISDSGVMTGWTRWEGTSFFHAFRYVDSFEQFPEALWEYNSQARVINSDNVIGGFIIGGPQVLPQAMLWVGNSMQLVPMSGINAIADSGLLAGDCLGSDMVTRACVYLEGNEPIVLTHPLDPTVQEGGALGLNESGTVVGLFSKVRDIISIDYYPFIWSSTAGTALLPAPAEYPYGGAAYGINEQGVVLGLLSKAWGCGKPYAFPFVWKQNVPVLVYEEPGVVTDINESCQIVGSTNTSDGQRATMWEFKDGQGRRYDLNALLPPNSGFDSLNQLRDIRDDGVIVGFGYSDHGMDQPAGLLLVPDGWHPASVQGLGCNQIPVPPPGSSSSSQVSSSSYSSYNTFSSSSSSSAMASSISSWSSNSSSQSSSPSVSSISSTTSAFSSTVSSSADSSLSLIPGDSDSFPVRGGSSSTFDSGHDGECQVVDLRWRKEMVSAELKQLRKGRFSSKLSASLRRLNLALRGLPDTALECSSLCPTQSLELKNLASSLRFFRLAVRKAGRLAPRDRKIFRLLSVGHSAEICGMPSSHLRGIARRWNRDLLSTRPGYASASLPAPRSGKSFVSVYATFLCQMKQVGSV